MNTKHGTPSEYRKSTGLNPLVFPILSFATLILAGVAFVVVVLAVFLPGALQ